MGDLAALPGLNLAALLPGGPGWMDVQRCLRHDPEGAFRLLYYGLALRGLEALPAPEQLLAPHSAEAPQISVLIPVHNHWAITLNALRSLVAMLLIELMRWLPIRRDSARSRQYVAPAERVEATEATILLNQRAPHELQPCQRSGLSPCALPAKLPGLLGQ